MENGFKAINFNDDIASTTPSAAPSAGITKLTPGQIRGNQAVELINSMFYFPRANIFIVKDNGRNTIETCICGRASTYLPAKGYGVHVIHKVVNTPYSLIPFYPSCVFDVRTNTGTVQNIADYMNHDCFSRGHGIEASKNKFIDIVSNVTNNIGKIPSVDKAISVACEWFGIDESLYRDYLDLLNTISTTGLVIHQEHQDNKIFTTHTKVVDQLLAATGASVASKYSTNSIVAAIAPAYASPSSGRDDIKHYFYTKAFFNN